MQSCPTKCSAAATKPRLCIEAALLEIVAVYQAGDDRRNRLSHQQIVAAREEIRI
jgi:hypothetical protein